MVGAILNSNRKGATLEARAKSILQGMDYIVAMQAKRNPVWRNGRVVANAGDIDLVANAIDLIAIKPGRRTLFVQVTTEAGLSARRAKLRAVPFDPAFHEVVLLGWVERAGFQVYRLEDDYLKGAGYSIWKGATAWPWEAATTQEKLPT